MNSDSIPKRAGAGMELDMFALVRDPSTAASSAGAAQETSFDGWFAGEAGYDPFVACAVAAISTSSIRIGTNVAVAFGRTPMAVAYSANDIQGLSGGRFVLGLGSQIKPHITRRYGMPWSQPAARMREFIAALHAIWAAWEHDTRLDFRGDFYEHTLMTPFFVGHQHGHGPPPVGVAAVGPLMTRVAGESANLFFAHAFTTERYLRAVTLPDLRVGIYAAHRNVDDVAVVINTFVVTGRTEQERSQVELATRQQLAFYASTPTYRRVLEQHGWGDLQSELHTLARQNRWSEMPELIDDKMLQAFAIVVETPEEAGPAIAERFGDLADRVCLYPTWQPDKPAVEAVRVALDGR